jgi:hypothetical protein
LPFPKAGKKAYLSCAEENTGVSKLVPAKTTAVVPILIKSLLDVFIELIGFFGNKN